MDHFKLVSEYKPTGDQPEAIAALAEGIRRGDKEQTLMGVTGSGKTFTMAILLSRLISLRLCLLITKRLQHSFALNSRSFSLKMQ